MRTSATVLLAFLAGGCLSHRTVPAIVEFENEKGMWEVQTRRLTLRKTGWQVTLRGIEVADTTTPPLLEKLIVEVENTSGLPIALDAAGISIADAGGKSIELSPGKAVPLDRYEPVRVEYAPGLRAETLPYPFEVTVRVRRGDPYNDTQSAVIRLR
jgi:hypothetical protein